MLKELTYAEIQKLDNTAEMVLAIKNLAYDDFVKFNDMDLFRLNFNYIEINGEWNYSYVILPKKYFDEVDTEWSSREFNHWKQEKSVYNQQLISNLSTDPIKLKTIRSAKFKTI